MPDSYRIEISLSKAKLAKLLVFSLVFIFLGLWILAYQPEVSNSLLNDPILKNTVGVLSILMGTMGVFFITRKMFDKTPGIVIDEAGITDNSSAIATGKILWGDITDIGEISVRASITSKQKFVTISVRNPDDYISAQKSAFKRKALLINKNNYGALATISANSLDTTFEELKNLLGQKLIEYKTEVLFNK